MTCFGHWNRMLSKLFPPMKYLNSNAGLLAFGSQDTWNKQVETCSQDWSNSYWKTLNLGSINYNWSGKSHFLQPFQTAAKGTFSHLACSHGNESQNGWDWDLWRLCSLLAQSRVIYNRLLRTLPSSIWILISPCTRRSHTPVCLLGSPELDTVLQTDLTSVE